MALSATPDLRRRDPVDLQPPGDSRFDRLIKLVFVACIAVGLVGAFVGLNTNSFWVDELYSAWVVGHGLPFPVFLSRALTDMHPPPYYFAAWVYASLFGDSEVALRSLSAIFACAAVLVFVVGTRNRFSPLARLFAGTVATSSAFWFYQSQNARDYPLVLCFAAGLLVLGLRVLDAGERGEASWRTCAPLYLLMALGSLTHFYIAFLSFSIIIMLFLYVRSIRISLIATFLVIAVLVALYVKLVIGPYSLWLINGSWIKNNLSWYKHEFSSAWTTTFSKYTDIALILCIGALAVSAYRSRSADSSGGGVLPTARAAFDRYKALIFCCAVALIMTCGAVVSSFLFEPSVTDRNLLVCSPFIWGVCAALYDDGVARLRGRPRLVVNAVLALVAVMTASIVLHRGRPHNEPFRASAAWINAIPACRGEPVPVLSDSRAGLRNGFGDVLTRLYYGHYLTGAGAVLPLPAVRAETGWLPAGLADLLGRRLSTGGCPVLAWSVHTEVGPAEAKALAQTMSNRFGGRPISVTTFYVHSYRLGRDRLTPGAFIVHGA